jgi:hypothetical protein
MTDSIGKYMLQIGPAADIYLGQFDDSKYCEDSEVFCTIKGDPDLHPDAVKKFEADVREKLGKSRDLDALDVLWLEGVSERVRKIGYANKAARNRIIFYFSLRKNEILKSEESAKVPA